MIRALEWFSMVFVPAGCAVLLGIGFVLHLLGRLGLALHRITPSWRHGRDPTRPR